MTEAQRAAAARAAGLKHYKGQPCKHHGPEAPRFASNAQCVDCQCMAGQQYRRDRAAEQARQLRIDARAWLVAKGQTNYTYEQVTATARILKYERRRRRTVYRQLAKPLN